MNRSEFFRKTLMSFFIIVTCISLVMGILGLIYEPDRIFGYEAYFSPLIFGVIGVVPSLIIYSKKELTIKQMALRKVLQLFVLEGLILSFGYFLGVMKGEIMFSVALSVLLIYILVHLISYIIDYREAVQLNEDLKAFQKR